MPGEDANIIKILVTTDNHLGFAEKDPVRANDSFLAFEEALKLAKTEDADMILLGGDLFHENKPSRKTFHRCTELLRQNCLGSRPCSLEFRSDPTVNFQHSRFPVVNYEDPNLNVSMPVFSIHGNHDDPIGQGSLCALDVLSAAGLVNYFGKSTNLDSIAISPILLQKGTTKLALYGLGAVRDERLHRLFTSRKVTMLRPREDTDEWFNMFVVHQNRTKHSSTNYLPEQVLDDFLDLVVWGHEHECLIEPQEAAGGRGFFVTQPGSTVATSLSEGEAKPKYCSLLQICGKQFQMRHIRLTSTRPFYFESMVLADLPSLKADDPDHGRHVEALCKSRVEALIQRAKDELIQHAEDERRCAASRQLRLPLIRLRVDHAGGFETFSTVRFGQQFVDRVANPKDLVLFAKRRQAADSKCGDDGELDFAAIEDGLEGVHTVSVEEMVKKYFEQAEDKLRLALLTERGVGLAVKAYVDKQESDAIKALVEHQIKATQAHLKTRDVKSEDDITSAMNLYREERKQGQRERDDLDALELAQASYTAVAGADEDGDDDGSDDGGGTATARARGRGSMVATAAAQLRRGRGRAAAMAGDVPAASADAAAAAVARGAQRGRGRGRGSARAARGVAAVTVAARGSAKRVPEQSRAVVQISDSDGDDVEATERWQQPAAAQRQGRGRAITYMSEPDDAVRLPPAKRAR